MIMLSLSIYNDLYGILWSVWQALPVLQVLFGLRSPRWRQFVRRRPTPAWTGRTSRAGWSLPTPTFPALHQPFRISLQKWTKFCINVSETSWEGSISCLFKKWAIPGLFFLYFRLFNTVDSRWKLNVRYKCLPMIRFEPQTSGVWSDRSTNWATTTALFMLKASSELRKTE